MEKRKTLVMRQVVPTDQELNAKVRKVTVEVRRPPPPRQEKQIHNEIRGMFKNLGVV